MRGVVDRTKPISCWTAEHSSIWNQLQLWSQKFHENRPALCKWYQHGKLRRSKQTKKLWLHLAKGAFDYCCWCDSQKIVLGTWESLAEVGAAEAVAGVDVDVVGWSWSCLSHRRRYYDTVFVSFLIIICKCLLDQPPLFIYHYSCLSLCLPRVFLCCACAAHFEGNKSQTQTKRKMHWKKTNLWNTKTWAMAMEMLAACKLRLLVSKLSLTTRACAPRGEAWQPQVRIWREEAAWEGWLLLWFLVNLKIFVFMTL